MNRTACLLAVVLTACVDSGCPKGSEEVDGICMESSSITGDGGAAGSGGSGPGSGDRPGTSGRGSPGPDAGADAAGDASSDAAAEPEDGGASTCEPGFAPQDGSCTDIDECEDGTAGCDANATCRNEPGTFTCECAPGYEGDGTTCTENPCEPRVNPCDAATTTCRADGGAAVCDCLEGLGRCDEDASACTTDLRADRANCGECGAACAGDLACTDGACEQKVTQLALGAYHSCALAANGEVLCWGTNNYGELGRDANSTRPLYEPTPTHFGKARLLDAGSLATCALSEGNALFCWGYNIYSWFADNPNSTSATVAEGVANFEQIANGSMHSCLLSRGVVECWGQNSGYTLGASGYDKLTFAQRNQVPIPETVQIDAWITDSCATGRDGLVRCWGAVAPSVINDATGQPLTGARQVSIGNGPVCAVVADGRALCWGANRAGQLGNPAALDDNLPHAVVVSDASGVPLSGVEQVAVGYGHACARLTSGAVTCWGQRDQLGNGGTGSSAQRFATPVRDIEDAIEIAAGSDHTCVRRRSGQVQCWGSNSVGQLGVSHVGVEGVPHAYEPMNVLSLP